MKFYDVVKDRKKDNVIFGMHRTILERNSASTQEKYKLSLLNKILNKEVKNSS